MDTISFDTVINRKGTNCSKWDAIPYDLQAEDIIPMWVADMDFASPPAIINAINHRLQHPVFGYFQFPDNYWTSIINWQQKRYHTTILQHEIFPVSSVLGGVAMAIQGLTIQGDPILVPTPGYHAFYNAIINNKRKLICSPMKKNGDKYELDLDNIENNIVSNHVKMILFCSPHNPTGRIWSTYELKSLVELCYKYHVYLVSDEIHADMTLTHDFSTIYAAGKHAEEIALALYAPTKTFNIAGLCTAFAVIKNPDIAKHFDQAILASGLKMKNLLGIEALISAYENCSEWVNSLQKYLLDNAKFAVNYINTFIPNVHAYIPEATYFLWIDFSKTGLSPDEIIQKCVFEAHVAITRGTEFIEGGDSFVRLNYSCPRSLLKEALTRLKIVFTKKAKNN